MAIDLSELELVWPAPLFAEQAHELLATGKDDEAYLGGLLEEAFHGDAAVLLYQQETRKAPMGVDPFDASPQMRAGADLVRELAERSSQLRRYSPPRYYRARQMPLERPARLNMMETKSRFAGLVAELASIGYFERAFGSYCYDSDDKPDVEGQRQLSELLGENQFSGPPQFRLWPMREIDGVDPSAVWPEGLFYDLIEALHDLVARPLSRSWHEYAREWDYYDFAKRPGQAVYRWRVNELLDRSEVPLRLAETGEDTGRLVTSAGDARDDLVERALESPEPRVQERVAHAVALFRDRHATPRTKHDATRTLGDVLELRRGLLKQELFTKDERQLFQLANEFALRHFTEQQKADYDPVFLDWVFWWFLATIELTDRLLARQGSGDTATPTAPTAP
ncbi:hypothetical protein [Modestobacter lapidis]|nr:hypothetical protein [Modestobacter lapidis]